MKRILLVAGLLLAGMAWTTPAQSQDTSEIQDAAWGLRFTPPEGWMEHQAPTGYLFIAPNQQGLLAVLPHETRTVEALRTEAQQGIADGAGTMLQLEGHVERFGENGLAADFSGWLEGNPARARVIGLISPHGSGASILVATAPQHYSEDYAVLAATVARSVVFTAPPAQAAAVQIAPAGSEEHEWHDFLQGCRLSYFNRYNSGYGGGGYSDERVVDLCPGYFTFSDHSETVFNTIDPVSGNDPYLHSDQRGAGQWSVVRQGGQSVLQLRLHDSTVQSLVLGYEDGKTFLDGRRWLRTCNPNDAVVEARPQCR